MSADFTYFPFLRTGLSSAVSAPDTAGAEPFVKLTATATVNGGAADPVKLRLAGPGEIRGMDASTIVVATDPAPGATGVPPEQFAAVELRPADVPWMFTPLGASGDRLRPWLMLVVTEAELGEPVVDASHPLPVLHVDHPDEALPDPAEAWAWAHVAAMGDTDAAGLKTTIATQPGRVVARILCPRRLEPERRYVAALVPVFEGGRKAGLGDTVLDTDKLANAWSVAAGAPAVDLPVYHWWTFHTGVGGDFRSLALRLEGRRLPAGAGSRPMDVTAPGGGLPALPANAKTTTLGLEGALAPDPFTPSPWDGAQQTAFESDIAALVNAANTAPNAKLGPPLWGRWQAGRLTFPTATPAWMKQLNADPRHRAAAGLGARVVQEQREQLMAQAWEQVGEVERANQRLRQAQLARAQGKSLHGRALPALSDGAFLQLTRPLHDRVLVDKTRTAFGEVAASSLPERLLDSAFRRVARPRGPLGRRLGTDPAGMIEKAAAGTIAATPTVRPPAGSPAIVASVERLPLSTLQARPGRAGFTPLKDWRKPPRAHGDTGPDVGIMSTFRQLVVDYATWRSTVRRRRTDAPPDLKPDDLRDRLWAGTDPDMTVPARTRAVVKAPLWNGAGDPLEPIMAAPRFPQPMSEPLKAISQELLLPGLQDIPAESVTAAVPNTRFIAAYMVGLNHEMSRELLYREYPTDQRGTYFRQFWDVRGRVPVPAPGTTDDIGAIDGWAAGSLLGAEVSGSGSGLLVVIVRGELLRRYPDAAVYAAPAKWTLPLGTPARRELDTAAAPLHPVFRGRLEPDLVSFAFSLTAAAARGVETPTSATDAPGSFIVFEQHSTAPHYGLDAAPETGPKGASPAAWDRVTWADVDDTVHPRQKNFAPAAQPSGWTWPGVPNGPVWGTSSAAMAAITLKRPTRLAIHASDLLEP